jgi:hypothetical protein
VAAVNVDYSATDAELLAAGLEPKHLVLAAQPFVRPGAESVDLTYLLAVWDARERRDLFALAVANPGQPVRYPPHAPRMGFVPEGWCA